MAIAPLIERYDGLLLDLDGCVWLGDQPTDRAVEAIEALRAAGRRIAFITNDGRPSTEDFVRRLWRLGFRASLEEVVSVGGTVQHVLAGRADRLRSAYVIGSAALVDHVAAAGVRVLNGTDMESRADVVVVAEHEGFDYAELRAATLAVAAGAELLGTCRDPTFPLPDGPSPGTGAVLAAVEYATGKQAAVVGKPERRIFEVALERTGAERALVVGDRLDSDLAGARAAGLDCAIVLTGVSGRAEAKAAEPPPVAIADSLAALVLGD